MTGHAPAVASWDFLTLFTLTIKPEKQTHLYIFRFFLNLVFNYCVMSDIQNSQPSDLEDVTVDLTRGHAPAVSSWDFLTLFTPSPVLLPT